MVPFPSTTNTDDSKTNEVGDTSDVGSGSTSNHLEKPGKVVSFRDDDDADDKQKNESEKKKDNSKNEMFDITLDEDGLGNIKPMDKSSHQRSISESTAAGQALVTPKISDDIRLVTEQGVLQWSMLALRVGVIADAINQAILTPNFPFLASPGTTSESFPSTAPFDFSAATYFLPMTSLIGSAITSAFIGGYSDKIGRRPCLLVCVAATVINQILKWFARRSFWGFCAMNFVNGLFGGTLPVAMAYVSDVHPNRAMKDKEIGQLIGFNMLGITGGGVMAILMESQGLFTPLFLGAAINFAATTLMFFKLKESTKASFHFQEVDDTSSDEYDTSDGEEDSSEEEVDNEVTSGEEDDVNPNESRKGLSKKNKDARVEKSIEKDTHPKKQNHPFKIHLFVGICVGAMFDNIGSNGLWPLALSPLAFRIFYLDFVDAGLPPIMSAVAYKWLSMMLALMVIPGAAMSQPIFSKIGAAGGCVMGNLVTAIGITACLLIASITPPSIATLSGMMVFLYLIMPFTVVSNLSTGPMLDRIAPPTKRGLVQGLNTTIMNTMRAVGPFALGAFADATNTPTVMWTCVGISIAAAIINFPLTRAPELGKTSAAGRPKHAERKAMEYEDHELVERVLAGEWVPADQLAILNEKRMYSGLPFLIPTIKSFEEDKKECKGLKTLCRHANDDFKFHKNRGYHYLHTIEASDDAKSKTVEQLHKAVPSKDAQHKAAMEIGKWFGEYLEHEGYFLNGGEITLYKQMIMKAFPEINRDGELNEHNIKDTIIKFMAVANQYFEQPQPGPAIQAFANSVIHEERK